VQTHRLSDNEFYKRLSEQRTAVNMKHMVHHCSRYTTVLDSCDHQCWSWSRDSHPTKSTYWVISQAVFTDNNHLTDI